MTISRPLPKRHNLIMTRQDRVSEWDNLEFTSDSPAEILDRLQNQGFEKVVVAGGTQINTLWAEAQLIDEIIVTICPLIFGHGLKLFADQIELDLELLSQEMIDEQVLKLHYRVRKP